MNRFTGIGQARGIADPAVFPGSERQEDAGRDVEGEYNSALPKIALPRGQAVLGHEAEKHLFKSAATDTGRPKQFPADQFRRVG
jgi:hypothetical protein